MSNKALLERVRQVNEATSLIGFLTHVEVQCMEWVDELQANMPGGRDASHEVGEIYDLLHKLATLAEQAKRTAQ